MFLWPTAVVVSLPSLVFGYCLSSLNTVISVGSMDDPIDCYTGADTSCPKGSILRDVRLTVIQQETATGLLLAGAWLGCALCNRPMDAFGRRRTTLFANVLFIVGGVLMAASSTVYTLSVGRFVSGLGVGIASAVVPVLLSEISTTSQRGALTSAHQLAITLGILVSGLMGYAFSGVNHGWRYVQGFTIAPALLQLALCRIVPESPMWICRKGRHSQAGGKGGVSYSHVASRDDTEDPTTKESTATTMVMTSPTSVTSLTTPLTTVNLNSSHSVSNVGTLSNNNNNNNGGSNSSGSSSDYYYNCCSNFGNPNFNYTEEASTVRAARAVLLKIRPKGWDIEGEVEELMNGEHGHDDDDEMKERGGGGAVGWLDLWEIRWAMVVGTVVMACQSLTGVNSVIFYSSTIFELAGFDDEILATVAVGVVNVAATLLAMRIIDSFGRKRLILSGTALMTGALAVLSCTLLVPPPSAAATNNNQHATQKLVQGYICVLAVLTYISGYAVGFGVVGWVVIAELVPYNYRAKACSVFVSVNWACNLGISLFTLTLIQLLGGIRHHHQHDDDGGGDAPDNEEAKKTGVALLYLIFMCVCLFSMLFVYFFVPETSGKNAETVTLSDHVTVVTTAAAGDTDDHTRNRRKPLLVEEMIAVGGAEVEDEEEYEYGGGGDAERSGNGALMLPTTPLLSDTPALPPHQQQQRQRLV